MTDERRLLNINLISDVAVLKSQGIEINRRLGAMDERFDTTDGKVDDVLAAVNENKGAAKQDLAFWGKVGGVSTAASAVISWVIKHIG